MRLRSGKSDVPKGSVVPRLLKYVQAIERTNNQLGASCRFKPAWAQRRDLALRSQAARRFENRIIGLGRTVTKSGPP